MAAPAQTVFHFFRLLGEVDVHGAIPGQADHRRELLGRAGPEAMRGDTDHRVVKRETACRLPLEQ